MKNRIISILLLVTLFLYLGSTAFAQTPAPAPQHFSIGGSVVSFMGPTGSTPASVADGFFNVTKSWSFGYQQITIPGLATAKLGLGAVEKPLSSFLGKKLTSKLVFDASKIGLQIYGGAGKLNQTALNVDRIAETAGVCVQYPVGANVDLRVVCGQWLHGGIVNGPLVAGLPTSAASSTAQVQSGIALHF